MTACLRFQVAFVVRLYNQLPRDGTCIVPSHHQPHSRTSNPVPINPLTKHTHPQPHTQTPPPLISNLHPNTHTMATKKDMRRPDLGTYPPSSPTSLSLSKTPHIHSNHVLYSPHPTRKLTQTNSRPLHRSQRRRRRPRHDGHNVANPPHGRRTYPPLLSAPLPLITFLPLYLPPPIPNITN
ncbi:hypothetical protein EJ05DRAFT_392440 [Pseudovirgaria hyperparasitica]|uniref:Uncharacterized protein n=1 Tax=Pseudovirgaria hyperparasitica TaxID=470096 RepID=A0A6A6W8V2_9PEZI|nr:uncharacterized protein EJ05DRAFT_392440 [Pseudovirgaria hyperparasitica]KAF2757521.1 hypothetical protein EJ05DRAFT_392440 [Pseudovirgaria hyperparasitica]